MCVICFLEPPPINDDIGAEKYKNICRELDIVPISRIISSLETDTLDLKVSSARNQCKWKHARNVVLWAFAEANQSLN